MSEGLCTKCSATQYCAKHAPKNERFYAVGNYYQGTVMDRERKVPVATVNMAVPGAKTQSGVDGAQFIADALNARRGQRADFAEIQSAVSSDGDE